MRLHLSLVVTLLLSTLAMSAAETALPLVSSVFGDHMVLPRDRAFPVWGWVQPGQQVTVAMAGKTAQATADGQGRWQVQLGPLPAGGPHELRVSGPGEAVIHDVLVGEVWLCMGQSNMDFTLGAAPHEAPTIAAAGDPQVRILTLKNGDAERPQAAIPGGSWQVPSATTAAKMPAVAYHFARSLRERLKVPVGVVVSAWGGTAIQQWQRVESIAAAERATPAIDSAVREARERKAAAARVAWFAINDPSAAATPSWADPNLDDSGWTSLPVPGEWRKLLPPGTTGPEASGDGIAWYRLAVDLPADWQGQPATIRVEGGFHNSGFVNGMPVGFGGEGTPQPAYHVPAEVLKAGRNVIAIRVVGVCGGGGLGEPQLIVSGKEPLKLGGRPWRWRFARPLDAGTLPPYQPPHQRFAFCEVVKPYGRIGNAMIAPLAPFSFSGAVWYQGESNDNRGHEYRWLLAEFITDLRRQFQLPELPMLVVQLPNFAPIRGREPAVTEFSPWADLREAQLLACGMVPRAIPVVTNGLGDDLDIHPQHKEGVAARLATAAMATVYGASGPATGPLFKGATFADGKARITFDQVGGGLVAMGGGLAGFAIVGSDGAWVAGDAVIDRDTVVVSAPGIAEPKAVRYQWVDATRASLANREGLPASPFRTDR